MEAETAFYWPLSSRLSELRLTVIPCHCATLSAETPARQVALLHAPSSIPFVLASSPYLYVVFQSCDGPVDVCGCFVCVPTCFLINVWLSST
jgi:hypothetical protein